MPPPVSADQPLLSFCIPTHNRAITLLPLVRRVLQHLGDEIQVVVMDNGSTDDTLTRLAEIQDPRLIVRANMTNRGVLFNVVNVLLAGDARYSALLLDKDSLDPALIPCFLEFLRTAQPRCGYCEYDRPLDTPARCFEAGEAALRGLAYSCHHPTGYFFRTDDLRDIDIAGRFTGYEFVGHFPFEFMHAELCLRGSAAIYQAPLFRPEVLKVATSAKSHGTNAAKEDAFFSPKGRLKMAVNFSIHILGLPLSAHLRRQLVLDRFAQGLWHATAGYVALMADEAICEHYHIGTRRIGRLEQLSIAWGFYRGFVSSLRADRRVASPPSGPVILLDTARRAARRVGRRLGLRFGSRAA